MVMPGEYSLPVGCARLRGSCVVAVSDSRQLLRPHRLGDQGYHPIATWIPAHGMGSPFARIVNDLVFDDDPLTEVGTKVAVLDEHGHRPRRGHKLVDSRLRIPAWGEVPLGIGYGLEKSAQPSGGAHAGFVQIGPVRGYFFVTAVGDHGCSGNRTDQPMVRG